MEIPNVNGLNIQDDDGDLEFNIALAPKDVIDWSLCLVVDSSLIALFVSK